MHSFMQSWKLSALKASVALAFALLFFIPFLANARDNRGGAPGEFDYYVLALSWSPGFCELEGRRKGKDQCFETTPRGFVVHGLWPQYEQGYPSSCNPRERSLPFLVLNSARDVFPDEGLARHQWSKHGTCSGLSPREYLDAVRSARDKVIIPAEFIAPKAEQNLSVRDIQRAFVEVNRALRADMVQVACRRNVLQEVRVCMTKDLRSFRPCSENERRACKASSVDVIAP
jgi:ribonuclease T2